MKTWMESFDFLKIWYEGAESDPLINLLFVLDYLVKYLHNDQISHFSY